MTEIWKDIKGYEGLYQVSNHGMIKSLDRIFKGILSNHSGKKYYAEKNYSGKVLNTDSKGRKYHIVCLVKNGHRFYKSIHRLVAESFIPNHENKPQVNHIDGNMKNNHISNLEWATRKENGSHASTTGLYRYGETHQNSKLILNTQTGLFYFSAREAADTVNITKQYLSCMLSGHNRNKTSFIYV